MDRGAQLVLPSLVVPAAAPRALRAPRLRSAGLPRQRGSKLHRGRLAGLLDQPRRTDLGDPDPVGSGFGRLRLGRRPRQLSQRAHVRPSRRRPDRDVLARGPASARQGHPPLPLRLLARDAARSGLRAAATTLRPRVLAARRPQDLEVARQRRRPARSDRCLRSRPGAILVCAGDLVRPGRCCVARRHP